MAVEYSYELWRNGEIISTGRLTLDTEAELGELVHVAGAIAEVHEIRATSEGIPRLILVARR